MKVLVSCEFSGRVRDAFRRKGHDAWSNDILPSLEASVYHLQGDAMQYLDYNWDLIIAHPPCSNLAVSGARWWKDKKERQEHSIKFFMRYTELKCKYAIENPIGLMSTLYRKPDQIIQPWMFGHGETKATCLWLQGLPKLIPTDIVSGREPRIHMESPGIKNGLTRWQRRSITLQGIANAMADQWGSL